MLLARTPCANDAMAIVDLLRAFSDDQCVFGPTTHDVYKTAQFHIRSHEAHGLSCELTH